MKTQQSEWFGGSSTVYPLEAKFYVPTSNPNSLVVLLSNGVDGIGAELNAAEVEKLVDFLIDVMDRAPPTTPIPPVKT